MTATEGVGDLVQGLLSTLTGKLIALAAVVGAVTTVWRVLRPPLHALGERLSRRRRLGQRLQQLACDVQVDYFQHLLGQPAQYVNRSSTTDELEHVFVFRDAYVQAVTDQHGKVGRFSVTCRSRGFQPRLNYHPGGYPDLVAVRLGRTRFARLGHTPDGVHAWLGARRFGYVESYYFGNPGNYQHYVFALNDAGEDESATGYIGGLFPSPGGNEVWLGLFGGSSDIGVWLDQQGVRSFRGATAINTYAVPGNKYRADLFEILTDSFSWQGLPSEHGITLYVAGDGQSWWAWRRTITGWCFAIGAAGPPPDQWEFDGPEPPGGFPGEDESWGEGPSSPASIRNW